MKCTRFFACLLLCISLVKAQNLVPNGDFESYSSLPNDGGQWNFVNGWTNAGGSSVNGYYGNPDFFHTNGTGPVKLPNTALAQVNPHGGDAIMGFLGYHDPGAGSIDVREYLMVQLSSPLVIGKTYAISFWVTNGASGVGHYYQCDGIGVQLSTSALVQSGTGFIDRPAQMEVAGELFSNQWVQQTFSFVADSSYSFLTIGNFHDDAHINYSVAVQGPAPFAGAYYFIDDVVVEETQGNATIEPKNLNCSISPNPFQDRVLVQFSGNEGLSASYQIFNLEGKLIQQGGMGQALELDLSELGLGVYLVVVQTAEQKLTRRIVKI